MRTRYSRTTGYVVANRRAASRPTIRTVQKKMSLGPTTAKFLGVAVLAVLAVIMLTRSSASSTDAYTQFELKKAIGAEERQLEEMRLEAQRAQSIQEIQKSAVKDELVPMGQAGFIEKGEVAGASTSKEE